MLIGYRRSNSKGLDFYFRGESFNTKEVTMVPSVNQERRVRELFDAHYTITELIERTGLPLDTIVKVLNAPRVPKRRAAASQ